MKEEPRISEGKGNKKERSRLLSNLSRAREYMPSPSLLEKEVAWENPVISG